MSHFKVNKNISEKKNQPKLRAFFDNSCAICRREVALYRFLDNNAQIMWIDISASDSDLSNYGLNRMSAMKEFHVIDANEKIHKGENAFIELWSVLPGYRFLSKVFRIKVFKSLLAYAYQRFARWRYKKQCHNGMCFQE